MPSIVAYSDSDVEYSGGPVEYSTCLISRSKLQEQVNKLIHTIFFKVSKAVIIFLNFVKNFNSFGVLEDNGMYEFFVFAVLNAV